MSLPSIRTVTCSDVWKTVDLELYWHHVSSQQSPPVWIAPKVLQFNMSIAAVIDSDRDEDRNLPHVSTMYL
jgi:hypothetical protein